MGIMGSFGWVLTERWEDDVWSVQCERCEGAMLCPSWREAAEAISSHRLCMPSADPGCHFCSAKATRFAPEPNSGPDDPDLPVCDKHTLGITHTELTDNTARPYRLPDVAMFAINTGMPDEAVDPYIHHRAYLISHGIETDACSPATSDDACEHMVQIQHIDYV